MLNQTDLTLRCPDCGEPLVYAINYLTCPNMHGRLVKVPEGYKVEKNTVSVKKRHAKEAWVNSLPLARLKFGRKWTIEGLDGLYVRASGVAVKPFTDPKDGLVFAKVESAGVCSKLAARAFRKHEKSTHSRGPATVAPPPKWWNSKHGELK